MRKSISKCSIITITAFFVGILLPIAYTAHLGLTTKEDTTVEASMGDLGVRKGVGIRFKS